MLKNYYLILILALSGSMMKGQAGNALNFDGSNDYISSAVPTVFNDVSTQDFTLEVRVYPTAFSTNRVFFVQTTSSNYLSLMLNSAGKLYVYGTGISSFATDNSLPLNTWTHIAVSRSVMGGLAVYLDGVLQTGIGGGTSSTGTANLMAFGAKSDGMQRFAGTMDEFRIWSVVRTPAEITAAMNTEIALPQNGLVAYYKFNQGIANGNNPTETTLNDELTNLNGTLHNFALSGTGSNWVGNSTLSTAETEATNLSFTVAPNPAADFITIRGLKDSEGFKMYSMSGQLVKTGNAGKRNSRIDVTDLARGMYIIQIAGQQVKFQKQ